VGAFLSHQTRKGLKVEFSLNRLGHSDRDTSFLNVHESGKRSFDPEDVYSFRIYSTIAAHSFWRRKKMAGCKKVFPLFLLFISVLANPTAQAADVCTSQKCTDYATYVRESLASNYTKIDPCQDFEGYVCNGWREKHPMRKDQSGVSVTITLTESIQVLLRNILESPYADTPFTGETKELDKKNFAKLTTAYKACLEEDTKIKAYGLEPMRKLLGELDQYFPVKKPEGMNEKAELTKAITWLNLNAVSALIGAGPSVSTGRKPYTGLQGKYCHLTYCYS
jgi:hypothetical protein